MLDSWVLYVILYIVLFVIFNQFYKISTKNVKTDGALTILLQIIGGLSVLLIVPLFEMKFPTEPKTFVIWFLALIFYSISDRLNTTVRKGMEASVFSIISQISTVFLIIAGLLFLKEPFLLNKIVGSIIILVSNVLVFYKKGKFTFNKYVALAIVSQIAFSAALFFDINISESFNLPMYSAISLLVPVIIVSIFEKIRFRDVKNEYVIGNKKAIIITGLAWGFMIFSALRAFQLGEVTIVAPLFAVTVIMNVVVSYIFLKERDNLFKKVIAALLIILSVLLINM